MSFLEKLKKGMAKDQTGKPQEDPDKNESADQKPEAQDEQAEDKGAETESKPAEVKKTTKAAPENKTAKTRGKEQGSKERQSSQKPNFEIKPISSMHTKEPLTKENEQPQEESQWLESEGQLVVDVFQTDDDLVIEAPIAGMKVEDLDVIIEEEIVTIKGVRKNPFTGKPTGHFIEECYWGPFSRKIILPLDTDGARADASMKDGILTIRIPKIQREKKRKVSIRE